jgi:transcriptional regulator with XRE-family HTH domain
MWNAMPADFGARLRALRIAAAKTQVQLARELGLKSDGYISKVEAGRRQLALEQVIHVAYLLGVSIDALLRGKHQATALPVTRSPAPVPVRDHRDSTTRPGDQARGFGEKLRYLRQQRGLTQAKLANLLDLTSVGYLSSLESGARMPSTDLVIRVADVFAVTTDYLLLDSISHESDPPP